MGAPSSPQTREERERGEKGIRAEDDVVLPEKAMDPGTSSQRDNSRGVAGGDSSQ